MKGNKSLSKVAKILEYHVVASDTLYGCAFALLNHGLTRYGIEVTFVDVSNLEEVKNALKSNTKVVYLEASANSTLKVNDIFIERLEIQI